MNDAKPTTPSPEMFRSTPIPDADGVLLYVGDRVIVAERWDYGPAPCPRTVYFVGSTSGGGVRLRRNTHDFGSFPAKCVRHV